MPTLKINYWKYVATLNEKFSKVSNKLNQKKKRKKYEKISKIISQVVYLHSACKKCKK